MGNWGTSIKDSDTFSDVYSYFFELYNKGEDPKTISEVVIEKNSDKLLNNEDEHDLWFALAFAQWETNSLDPDVLSRVDTIITSGKDLKLWKELGASNQDLKNREIALSDFLEKIKSNRTKSKQRKKPKHRAPIFSPGSCLVFKMQNGNFGGAVILATDQNQETAYNLVATTRINKKSVPILQDFEQAEVLIKSYEAWENEADIVWCSPDLFKENYSELFDSIGNINVEIEYDVNEYTGKKYPFQPSYTSVWNMKENAEQQFQYEKSNPKPNSSITVEKLTKKKKWWHL